MAGLSAAGLGSGLDVNGIVSQLMAIERRPLELLQKQQSTLQAQLSSIGKLKSALSDFQSAMSDLSEASKFKVFSASVEDESYFSVSASSSAAPGSYAIEVEQLAQAHKMASAATDSATALGAAGDTIQIDLGTGATPNATGTFQVEVGGKTLSQIAQAINNASDNPGVTASLINEDSGQRLILTADDSGTSNIITVSDSVGSVAANDLQMSTLTSAQDAKIYVEGTGAQTGYLVTSETNKISDAIEGVTLDLKKSTAGAIETVTVARDDTAITENVQAFVDKYNALFSTMKNLREGNLSGDSSIRSIESGIRNILNTAASGTGGFSYLSEIGITTDKETGKLTLDSTKLTEGLDSDFDSVSQLFANDDQGFAFRLEAYADTLLDSTDGLIKAREDGLNGRIDFVQDRQADMEYRLEQTEKRYQAQFSALDVAMSQMQSTSAYLSQQLAGLPMAG